jgi:hypothetical protein
MATNLAVALERGDIERGQCDRCGGAGDPLLRRVDKGVARIAGWRCYRCRHWPADAYYVYVVELSHRAGHQAVYVGQSALYPAERFSQHLTGYKAASAVRQHGMCLRPDLFADRNPIRTREDAERMEARLASELRLQGFRVYGGH